MRYFKIQIKLKEPDGSENEGGTRSRTGYREVGIKSVNWNVNINRKVKD